LLFQDGIQVTRPVVDVSSFVICCSIWVSVIWPNAWKYGTHYANYCNASMSEILNQNISHVISELIPLFCHWSKNSIRVCYCFKVGCWLM